MSAPAQIEPPDALARMRGWPGRRRIPRWVIPAAVVLLGIAVAVGLVHRPSHQERASDMRGVLYSMKYDIDSCTGSLQQSLIALHQVDSGTSTAVGAAVGIANSGAANCSPANNELIDDLENYQVPESLASFNLQNAVNGLITWAAPDAVQAQTDIAKVLAARGTAAEPGDLAAMHRALAKLASQRAAIDRMLAPAIRSLTPHSPPPALAS